MTQDLAIRSNPPQSYQFKLDHDDSAISFSDQHPSFYNFILGAFSLLAYSFLLLFPLSVIALGWFAWQQYHHLSHYTDYIFLASEFIAGIICIRFSYHLFTLTFDKPDGVRIDENDAQYLRDLIHEIQLEDNTAKIHHIHISKNFESKIIRVSKSGFPFAFTNTLILGLPLIQSLSNAQLKIVILRELLHITDIRSHYSAWFYYQRNVWNQFLTAHQNSWSINSFIMRSFFSWYAPLYKLLSQASQRQEELYVDKQLYIHKHHENLIDIISILGISEDFFYEQHIPKLLRMAYQHEFPPYFPYESFERDLYSCLDNDFCEQWFNKKLNRELKNITGVTFQQRLYNLGVKNINLPELNNGNLSSQLLGQTLPVLQQQFDDDWIKQTEAEWLQHYRLGQAELNKIKEYRVLLIQGLLPDKKIWEFILLIKKYLDNTDAISLYKKIALCRFTDPRISFDIGRSLLDQLDPEGIELILKTIKLDKKYAVICCQLLTKYYNQIGDKKMAQSYRRQVLEHQLDAA